jgi:N utilization substance protein B
MLTRRYLRIKVLQQLYEVSRKQETILNTEEKKLIQRVHDIYNLYIHQLSFLLKIKDFAEQRIEEGKQKYFPTQEELNPNMKFVRNMFLVQLESNISLQKYIETYRINWAEQQDMIRNFYKKLIDSDLYKNYMAVEPQTYTEDKEFMMLLVFNLLADYESLRSHYESVKMDWVNDYDMALIMMEKTIRFFNKKDGPDKSLPSLYSAKNLPGKENDDQNFVRQLFRLVYRKSKEYEELIVAHTTNWDLDRIALIDILIIKMALAEFLNFPSIPTKVTINEYIELSKLFSTPKSNVFVNGMLDTLMKELTDEGRIKKQGRGLIQQ